MTPSRRWTILGAILLATLLAAYFVDDEAPAETEATVTKRHARVTAAPVTVEQAREETPVSSSEEDRPYIDPFRAKRWFVPPPPIVSKPVAPPLPFRYVGQLVEAGERKIFVESGGRQLIFKAGDVLDGRYQVLEADASRVVFLYLPMNERQEMPVGRPWSNPG